MGVTSPLYSLLTPNQSITEHAILSHMHHSTRVELWNLGGSVRRRILFLGMLSHSSRVKSQQKLRSLEHELMPRALDP